mmetsp:Transcript_22852/g.55476  ORF Transcript_22852/g.55476 Transcript_22852/m.55476 type:complete len:455 (-) Transcript_22852:477-1841(-)
MRRRRRVVVLEARGRVGGRACTTHKFGYPMDLGGQWIHSACAKNPMLRQASKRKVLGHRREAAKADGVRGNPPAEGGGKKANGDQKGRGENGLVKKRKNFPPKHANVPSRWHVDMEEGGLADPRQVSRAAARLNKVWGALETETRRLEKDKSVQEVIAPELEELKAKMSPFDKRCVQQRIEGLEEYEGGEISSLSARFLQENTGTMPGGNGNVSCGYGDLITRLAEDAKLDIRLNCKVTAICSVPEKHRVEVTLENKSKVTCKAVILAVPLNILKMDDIVISPKLPAEFKKSLSFLHAAKFNKIIIEFEEAPEWKWKDDSQNTDAHTLSSQHVGFLAPIGEDNKFRRFVNWSHFCGRNVWLGYTTVSYSKRMEHLSDEQVFEDALKVFKASMDGKEPTMLPKVAAYRVANWSKDRLSQGSWSYVATGGTIRDIQRIASGLPERHIFFAGAISKL